MNTNNSGASTGAIVKRIRAHLPKAMYRDRYYVRQKLNRLQKTGRMRDQKLMLQELIGLEKKLIASVEQRKARTRRVPQVSFPRELPISARSREIINAIQDHPVVIISGETGCGKSTQIPKMCLRADRGVAGMIACTQPRRIAAITIAHRIASELDENLGRSVGYKIRFKDRTSPESFIKILTDGLLLAETQSDPHLSAYDTLIIDEAHERSLNIDFLLGISRRLLDIRPELKLIITSATLDTEKFACAFQNAPVIEVSGRQYPVEVKYCSPESFPGIPRDADYVDLAVEAVEQIKRKQKRDLGDILVFMPTEQDILETCERLDGRRYAGTTVLPLYARLPGRQQGRVYNIKGAKVVVATNVAETSLTIPGIQYVVDTGLARISQYQPETRINSLPISPISRSSADQRKGRCGRVQNGVCIRLYSEKEYQNRLAFTPPEIIRSNLAEVILRMIDLRLGHPADFPFIDSPKPKHIKDGYDTLFELGALNRKGRERGHRQEYHLTDKGQIMARMPLDPKISRMLLEARDEGCLSEVAIIAAALSIRDPRERPPDKAKQADVTHAPFRHPDSDFLTLLNIWERYHSEQEQLTSRSRQRRFCNEHFLSFPRMREWVLVHEQILSILQEQKIQPIARVDKIQKVTKEQKGRQRPHEWKIQVRPQDRVETSRKKEDVTQTKGEIPIGRRQISKDLYAAIHRSILSGFLSNIAVLKEKNIYAAAKGREVMVFPGSTLFGKSRPWIASAEMVRTSRLFARTAARIDPAWLEDLGAELCRSSYSNEHWDRDRGEVVALERVTLYGLEIVSNRRVSYGRIDPEQAHEIFVQSALVNGELNDPPEFLQHNLDLVKRLANIEEKMRRRGYLFDPDVLAELYSQRLPPISDERSLRKYIQDRGGDDFLRMGKQDILKLYPDDKVLAAFPDHFEVGEQMFPVSYRFSPGDPDDGATLRIPLSALANIPGEALEWGVPGHFEEKISALVKGLPKRYRKLLVPVSETVAIILKELKHQEDSLYKTLSDFVRRRFNSDIPASAWAQADIPIHLKMRIAVMGPDGQEIESSRTLETLKENKWTSDTTPASEHWTEARRRWEREGLTTWDFDRLPETVSVGPFVNAYPALVPGKEGSDIRLFSNKDQARQIHPKGVRALLYLRFKKDLDFIRQYLVLPEDLQLHVLYFGGKDTVEKALMEALQKEVLEKDIRSKMDFSTYADDITLALFEKSHALTDAVSQIIRAYHKVRTVYQNALKGLRDSITIKNICAEVAQELETLIPKNFILSYSLERLVHIPRYLEALKLRLERGRYDPAKDRAKAESVDPFAQALMSFQEKFVGNSSPEIRIELDEFRWMMEEFKVSIFAPELKTAYPISAKRLTAKLKALHALEP
jgi:ATP-dependent helicase HrpA